jgi:hypothetical protein
LAMKKRLASIPTVICQRQPSRAGGNELHP